MPKIPIAGICVTFCNDDLRIYVYVRKNGKQLEILM